LRQFVMNAEPELIKNVDRIVQKSGVYSSRNDFVRDAIRCKVSEIERMEFSKGVRQLAEKALSKGWNGKGISKKEKEKAAEEFFKSKGWLEELQRLKSPD